MKKFYYKLIGPGIKSVGKDENNKDVLWHVPIFSELKYVYAKDQEAASQEVLRKLKKKWTGILWRPNVN